MQIIENYKDFEAIVPTKLQPRYVLKDYSGGGNASFSYDNGGPEAYIGIRRPCHFDLTYMTSSAKGLLNCFTNTTRSNFNGHPAKANQREMHDFLFRLYASVVEDDGVYLLQEKGVDKGIYFTEVNKRDVKLLTSFLVSTRLHQQHGLSPVFVYLQEQGFTPETAFILIHHFGGAYSLSRKKFILGSTNGAYGDMTLNLAYKKQKDDSYLEPLRIYKRDPVLFGSLLDGQKPQPCNRVWNGRKTPPIKLNDNTKYSNSEIDNYGNAGVAKSIHAELIRKSYNENVSLSKDLVSYIEDTWRKGEAID